MLYEDMETYIAHCATTRWSPAMVRTTTYRMQPFLRWLTERGFVRWADISSHDLDAFMGDLLDKGLVRGTRRNYAWVIRELFAWLARRGRVLVDPALDLHEVIVEGDEPLLPAPLSEDEVARIFDLLPSRTATDLRNRLHIELLYGCALRLSESVDLDVSDLDLRERTVLVRGGKGDKDRCVPMMRGVLAATKDYLAVRRLLVQGPDHGALLLGRHGERLHKKIIANLLGRISKLLGKRVHPHLLRHSLAVHLLRNNVDIRVIQEILGHANLDTTKTYLRLVPGHLREDYDKAMPPIAVEMPRG
ncbi:MAG: tyrosine-type recombinase/integrase [Planctomycetes bacterium]|nr:tyrosine-type recombinase/integrase [Planctomycetota bacterium]